MLEIDRGPDGLLYIGADGVLTTEDYARFAPRFEELTADTAPPILIDLGPGFTGWTLGGLWSELRFDAEYYRRFGRVAIVGDKRWQEWGTKLTAPMFPSEIRFFDSDQRDGAIDWLRTASAGDRK